MGFLDRFKAKEHKPQIETEKSTSGPVSIDHVYLFWNHSDRRNATQDELKALQSALSKESDGKIRRYSPVFCDHKEQPMFGELPSLKASFLYLTAANRYAVHAIPKGVGEFLGMKGEDAKVMAESLVCEGYLYAGSTEDRINDAKYSVLLERLGENGITISTSDKTSRVREIIEKTDPSVLEELLSEIPLRYNTTEKGKAFLDANPILGEFYSDDAYGISLAQAVTLKTIAPDTDLFSACKEMYMAMAEAYWALADYKSYYEYSTRLAYLLAVREPREACYALAHLINANSLYKSSKILWEKPLQAIYSLSDLTVQQIVDYTTEQYTVGIYPKRTKVDQFSPVFTKYLAKTPKRK